MQREVIRRVEAAGGRMETIRQGAISHATAEAELSANLNGAISQYTRRTSRDRSWDAVEVAIEEGKIPWHQTPPGYLRTKDSKLTPDPDTAPVIETAFAMRAGEATIEEVRDHLYEHGIERSYHGTAHLLRDRLYIGQIHFGKHTPNLSAHESIIDLHVFNAVQKRKDPRGRRGKSERLLARLGVLRCDNCDGRMSVGTQRQKGRNYSFYRCPGKGSAKAKRKDCPMRLAISAEMIEEMVVDRVKELTAAIKESATYVSRSGEAHAALERAQAALDAAIEAFEGLEAEPAAIKRLRQLRVARDEARDRYEQDAAAEDAEDLILSVDKNWDDLTFDEQRDLIKATIPWVRVKPGRGPERVEFPEAVRS